MMHGIPDIGFVWTDGTCRDIDIVREGAAGKDGALSG